jgi:hypothetical protein
MSQRAQRRAEAELRQKIAQAAARTRTENVVGDEISAEIMNELRNMDPRFLGFNPNHNGHRRQGENGNGNERYEPEASAKAAHKQQHHHHKRRGSGKSTKSAKSSKSVKSGKRAEDEEDQRSVEAVELDPIMLTELEPDDVTVSTVVLS